MLTAFPYRMLSLTAGQGFYQLRLMWRRILVTVCRMNRKQHSVLWSGEKVWISFMERSFVNGRSSHSRIMMKVSSCFIQANDVPRMATLLNLVVALWSRASREKVLVCAAEGIHETPLAPWMKCWAFYNGLFLNRNRSVALILFESWYPV